MLPALKILYVDGESRRMATDETSAGRVGGPHILSIQRPSEAQHWREAGEAGG